MKLLFSSGKSLKTSTYNSGIASSSGFLFNLGDQGPPSAEVKLAVNPCSAADAKLRQPWLHGWLMESGVLILVGGSEILLGLAAAPAFSHS